MKCIKFVSSLVLFTCLVCFTTKAQQKANDVTAPLDALQPEYAVPYKIPTANSIKMVMDKIYFYLDSVTPPQFINKQTGQTLTSPSLVDTNTIFKPGDFRLTSYEWGVTYAAMLHVFKSTGDDKYLNYTKKRFQVIGEYANAFKSLYQKTPQTTNPLRQVIKPKTLDDAGAMCAAMIQLQRTDASADLRPLIENYINYISTKQYRLKDGTLARNRPQKNTLWLDDMYMGIPALAQMGKLTDDKKYYDDAIKQVLQFSARMFNTNLNIYMHGWVEGMQGHPEFHWARANGWALLAMTELLNVLPENYNGRDKVLRQLQLHIKGLTPLQSGKGFWHQLLDRNDSYLETSATAIYAYCIANAINKGWIDAKAYGPACLLAWNAITTKVNDIGQVEGTCVGTGMAFDPAFYYYRPTNVFAAHGYGPVLLAGAEIIDLLKKYSVTINDSSIQLQ
jgi:unsaturated rhamnogalacturonyl hydrolase